MSTDSKQAFTPGPWSYSHRMIPGDKDGMYATQIYDGAGVTIATADWYPVRGARSVSTNRDENARLIAAAPEMYEALKRAREYVMASHSGDVQADADLRAIDSALLKATGASS